MNLKKAATFKHAPLSCPFCGCEPEFAVFKYVNGYEPRGQYRCTDTSCQGRAIGHHWPLDVALAKWNRRCVWPHSCFNPNK